MTKEAKKLLESLIEQISIDNNPTTLDDDYPDMMTDNESESLQELVDFIDEEYDVQTEGYMKMFEALKISFNMFKQIEKENV